MTNGCICCTIQGDLLRTLEEILNGYHPKRLFIEATGVADPFDVLGFLKTSQMENRISVPKVVTVLAGDLWEGREYFGPLFFNQIKAAELLLLNKVDLLPKEEVSQALQEKEKSIPPVPLYLPIIARLIQRCSGRLALTWIMRLNPFFPTLTQIMEVLRIWGM